MTTTPHPCAYCHEAARERDAALAACEIRTIETCFAFVAKWLGTEADHLEAMNRREWGALMRVAADKFRADTAAAKAKAIEAGIWKEQP